MPGTLRLAAIDGDLTAITNIGTALDEARRSGATVADLKLADLAPQDIITALETNR